MTHQLPKTRPEDRVDIGCFVSVRQITGVLLGRQDRPLRANRCAQRCRGAFSAAQCAEYGRR